MRNGPIVKRARELYPAYREALAHADVEDLRHLAAAQLAIGFAATEGDVCTKTDYLDSSTELADDIAGKATARG